MQFISNYKTVETDYKVLDWSEANNLKLKENTKFIRTIEYNLGQLYQLKDSSYVVIPINPFGKALLTKDKKEVDNWIQSSYFPTDEAINSFYFKNSNKINALVEYTDELKGELYAAAGLTSATTAEEIDRVYQLLKAKKKFAKYKLNFMFAVGDFLICQPQKDNVFWGLSKSRQLLNPVTELVLIKESKGIKQYFKLEDSITGKWGYNGMKEMLHSYYYDRWSKPNEIDTVEALKLGFRA